MPRRRLFLRRHRVQRGRPVPSKLLLGLRKPIGDGRVRLHCSGGRGATTTSCKATKAGGDNSSSRNAPKAEKRQSLPNAPNVRKRQPPNAPKAEKGELRPPRNYFGLKSPFSASWAREVDAIGAFRRFSAARETEKPCLRPEFFPSGHNRGFSAFEPSGCY